MVLAVRGPHEADFVAEPMKPIVSVFDAEKCQCVVEQRAVLAVLVAEREEEPAVGSHRPRAHAEQHHQFLQQPVRQTANGVVEAVHCAQRAAAVRRDELGRDAQHKDGHERARVVEEFGRYHTLRIRIHHSSYTSLRQ